MDLNLIPSFIAFWATAPRVRRSFFAACVAESLAFARLRKLLTSSLDHADTLLRFLLAIDPPARKNTYHTRGQSRMESRTIIPYTRVCYANSYPFTRVWYANSYFASCRGNRTGELVSDDNPYRQMAEPAHERGANSRGLVHDLEHPWPGQELLPEDLQLQFGKPVADAAVNAVAEG